MISMSLWGKMRLLCLLSLKFLVKVLFLEVMLRQVLSWYWSWTASGNHPWVSSIVVTGRGLVTRISLSWLMVGTAVLVVGTRLWVMTTCGIATTRNTFKLHR
jgi:hypothetical protein